MEKVKEDVERTSRGTGEVDGPDQTAHRDSTSEGQENPGEEEETPNSRGDLEQREVDEEEDIDDDWLLLDY